MPRETQRRSEQRAAAFAVRSGTAKRRPMTEEEAQAIFTAIDRKQATGFGIRKLSTLELDGLYKAPPWVPWENHITLLYYAAWRRRDCFVNSLLRAGADPAVRDGMKFLTEGVTPRAKLDAVRPELAAWTMQVLVRLRHAGSKVDGVAACELCKATAAYKPLVWEPCGHACCEECHWARVCTAASSNELDFSCPSCGACLQEEIPCAAVASAAEVRAKPRPKVSDEHGANDWVCNNCHYTNFRRRVDCRNCGKRDDLACSEEAVPCQRKEPDSRHQSSSRPAAGSTLERMRPEELRLLSFKRWEELPVEKSEQVQRHAEKFRAMDANAAAAARLGTTRAERTLELHKAASAGDRRRLEALVNAGVHINATNEYGQTALFLAASAGHAHCIEFLLSVDVDVEYAANGGSTPVVAAAALSAIHGPPLALLRLLEARAELDKAGAEGKTARNYMDLAVLSPEVPVALTFETRKCPSVTKLIDDGSAHPGAGACYVDDAFTEEFLCRLEKLFRLLPVAERQKTCTSDRSYYCDSEGWIQREFYEALRATSEQVPVNTPMAHMRFLHYADVGGGLAAHVDLARTSSAGQRSTHTFLLYLSDCHEGGETVLLERLDTPEPRILAAVTPRRGRLLIYPHLCPHLAAETVEVPKLLLRGEMFFVQKTPPEACNRAHSLPIDDFEKDSVVRRSQAS